MNAPKTPPGSPDFDAACAGIVLRQWAKAKVGRREPFDLLDVNGNLMKWEPHACGWSLKGDVTGFAADEVIETIESATAIVFPS